MDISNKICGSIICGQLFKIISKHSVKCQFGSTPGVGYQDGTFTIKTLLHLRHNHNFPTWVAFIDLVKAFDTFNYALLIAILGKYGAPPRLWSTIKRMYNRSIFKLIIIKVQTSIDYEVGVKSRRNHGPGTISVLNNGLLQNTRRQVNGPGTKLIPICTKIQITNINWTISEPQIRHFLVWNYI